jgi:H+/Cl- antiporter ClcA
MFVIGNFAVAAAVLGLLAGPGPAAFTVGLMGLGVSFAVLELDRTLSATEHRLQSEARRVICALAATALATFAIALVVAIGGGSFVPILATALLLGLASGIYGSVAFVRAQRRSTGP